MQTCLFNNDAALSNHYNSSDCNELNDFKRSREVDQSNQTIPNPSEEPPIECSALWEPSTDNQAISSTVEAFERHSVYLSAYNDTAEGADESNLIKEILSSSTTPKGAYQISCTTENAVSIRSALQRQASQKVLYVKVWQSALVLSNRHI